MFLLERMKVSGKLFKLFKSIFPRFTLKYSFVDLKYLNCKKKWNFAKKNNPLRNFPVEIETKNIARRLKLWLQFF